MKYRHELKYEITYADMLILRSRLPYVMSRDSNAVDGKYLIRSLYFDNDYNKALKEKIDGVNKREKFRIRMYNFDSSLIKLEKKSKINGLCRKDSTIITREQTLKILNGDYFGFKSDNALLNEFYVKVKNQLLKPKTIVDYTREPFVLKTGNVRVTLDYNIKSGIKSADFLNPDTVTVLCENNPVILEVKWDEFLPDVVKSVLDIDCGRQGSFSKYAACRIYG